MVFTWEKVYKEWHQYRKHWTYLFITDHQLVVSLQPFNLGAGERFAEQDGYIAPKFLTWICLQLDLWVNLYLGFFFTCENEGVMFNDLAKSNWVYNFYEDTLEILLLESHDEKLFCNSKNNKIFEHSPPLDSEEDKAFLCIVWHYVRKNSKLSFKSRKKYF